jgi:AcrR family transcriptional regulator
VTDELLPTGDPSAVLRRAPFSTNPRVGMRGRQAQQRILDAALQVFAEVGYHRCVVSSITEAAGCSRAAFYQYFSSKEDVFRHLAGQVARQLTASAEALEAITPDVAGWETLRAWIDRHAVIYDRYESVFRVFQAAAESDAVVAAGSARIGARDVGIAQAKLTTTTLPNRHVSDVIALLLNVMSWTPRLRQLLQSALPPDSLSTERMAIALTDVAHRTLFGVDHDVNVRPPPSRRLPRVPGRSALLERLQLESAPREEATHGGARTLQLLLDTAREMLVRRGYHATRVDDITEAAGVSHGAFYRYFENKDHIVRLVTLRALKQVAEAFDHLPGLTGEPASTPTAVRQWLRRYNAAQASQVAMVRVWADVIADDPRLEIESAAALDWGRNRICTFLTPRGFGDVEAEALLMIPLLDAVGGRRRVPANIDAAALIVERGLLGLEPGQSGDSS